MSRFLNHLELLFDALAAGRPFAFTRCGDGERAILEGREISTLGTNRHWCYRPSQGICTDVLGRDLNQALEVDDPRWTVGISDPCCSQPDYDYYVTRLGAARLRERTSYANLFSNGNWKYLAARLQGVLSATRRRVVLVSNFDKDWRRARHALPYNEVEHVPVCEARYREPIPNRQGSGHYHGGCTLWYCDHRAEVRARFEELGRAFSGAVFLVSFGPVSNLLIERMFAANRDNTYLDMGHSLDGILYGDPSRGYMVGEDSKMCADMPVGWMI